MNKPQMPTLPKGYRFFIKKDTYTYGTYYLVLQKRRFGLFWANAADRQIAYQGSKHDSGYNLTYTAHEMWRSYSQSKKPLFQTGPINSRS